MIVIRRAARRTHGRALSASAYLDSPFVQQYAAMRSEKMTMAYAFDFARNLTERKIVLAVQYLQKELPVRLAHAVQLFQHLPYIVAVNPHILEVMLVNLVTFDALRGLPPVETYEQAKHYAGFAMHAAQLHMNFLPTLVSGISAAKMLPSELGVSATELDLFMDDVVRQRLNRRVILAHIAALVEAFQKKTAHDEDWLGAFHGRCSPAEEIGHATEIVRELSMRRFRCRPNPASPVDRAS
ncbi:[Pyruvate dehydrogenase (acetyl-transferring)] kinase [Diplonema papillatum]|nr:[Pyruvate dehydrogenase (acetyl-transferring)] kinase [Diplonema papillatum]